LKILHPSVPPTDKEFDEYVEYAVECRRRVKEQMNKRKTDDEFAKINLSYINCNNEEVIVYCNESKLAIATQDPSRRNIHDGDATETSGSSATVSQEEKSISKTSQPIDHEELPPATITPIEEVEEKKEQHFTIHYGAIGYSYESIMGDYLFGAKVVEIDDPYLRLPFQIQNFVRFCEAVVKNPTVKTIKLSTTYDESTDVKEMSDHLSDVQQSLLEMDIKLEININEHLHDREIRIDNGWTIKIGRGLDFYQKPDSWFGIGANDLSLRKCLETKIDIFKR
jgi:ATP-dependent Lon protease